MSECVVRMEMPENCCECQLRQEDYEMGEEFCPFTGVECLSIGRQNNCPIICQLPEGHGRLVDEKSVRWAIDDIVLEIANRTGRVWMTKNETMEYVNNLCTIVPADTAESPSPKPTDPVPIRDVYYVMTECDVKTGTVKYEPRERIEL